MCCPQAGAARDRLFCCAPSRRFFAADRRRWELPFVCTGAEATVADALAGLAALLTQHGARLPDGRDLTRLHLRVFPGRAGAGAGQQALPPTAKLPMDLLQDFNIKVVVRYAMQCCMRRKHCNAC